MDAVVSVAVFSKSQFPESGYCDNDYTSPWLYCRLLDCDSCRLSPASETFHPQCLRAFLSISGENGLRWLRIFTTSRSPWPGALPLDLEPFVCSNQWDSFWVGPEADSLGLPAIRQRLPPEIRTIVWEYCSPCPVTSQLAALELGAMAALEHRGKESIPLDRIDSWSRGGQIHCCPDSDKPVVRLAFDFRGLQCIERLSETPRSQSGNATDNKVFMIEDIERLADTTVEFQVRFKFST